MWVLSLGEHAVSWADTQSCVVWDAHTRLVEPHTPVADGTQSAEHRLSFLTPKWGSAQPDGLSVLPEQASYRVRRMVRPCPRLCQEALAAPHRHVQRGWAEGNVCRVSHREKSVRRPQLSLLPCHTSWVTPAPPPVHPRALGLGTAHSTHQARGSSMVVVAVAAGATVL